ncbi:hypothetical protein RRG08_015730 [Elysia crispata]|uniref:Uncharacterized protein n=1 Tax=Elysia crispata TaxID=231223 RepID=A0AAE1DA03_9GAST|nr:hypothetical protein RRG08_015730 [Elysia crispata]
MSRLALPSARTLRSRPTAGSSSEALHDWLETWAQPQTMITVTNSRDWVTRPLNLARSREIPAREESVTFLPGARA